MMASRRMSEKASHFLSDEDKERMFNAYSSLKKISLFPIIALFLSYFICLTAFKDKLPQLNNIFIGLLFLYAVITYTMQIFKIRKLNLPKEYMKKYMAGKLIIFGSVLFFAAIAAYSKYAGL